MTGLEALDKLAKQIELDEDVDFWEIRNAHLLVEKSLKALEIISKKNVDMLLVKKYDNASDYNSAVWLSGRDKLTEEEFKILKGVK